MLRTSFLSVYEIVLRIYLVKSCFLINHFAHKLFNFFYCKLKQISHLKRFGYYFLNYYINISEKMYFKIESGGIKGKNNLVQALKAKTNKQNY